jgi:hypothetical protein
MSEPAPIPSKPPDEDADVYCLKCGYNLRGLSGEPRRCPECFGVNWVGEFEVPSELVARQLRRMESAATICVASALLFIFVIVCVPPLSETYGGDREPDQYQCDGFVLFVFALISWICAFRAFRKACRYRQDCARVLLWYHAYGLSLSAVVIGVVALGAWLIDYLVTPREVGPPDEQVRQVYTAVLGIAITLGIVRFLPPLHQRATKRLNEVQYEGAVHIVRERLRREIALRTPEPPPSPH